MISENSFKNKVQIILNNFNAGNFENTLALIKKLLKEIPNHEYLLNMQGLCYQKLNDFENASKTFLFLIKINSSNYTAKNNYATLLKSNGNILEAKNILENIIIKVPNYIAAINNLANLYRELGNFNKAIELYNQILKNTDENKSYSKKQLGIIHYNLSLCYQQTGDKEKSLINAKKTLMYDENITQVYNIISSLTDYSDKNLDNDVVEMENRNKDNSLDNLAKVPIYFSIGKAYEDRKEYEKSFNNYFQANKLFYNLNKYNFDKDLKNLENLKVTFQKEEVLSLKNTNSTNFNFIFICGMPRSGTTLIEQIISTHNEVSGLGETNYLDQIIDKKFDLLDKDLDNKIKTNFNKNKDDLVDIYQKKVDLLNPQNKVITDKSLLNFKNVGFIKVFFPNSKIIINQRDFKNNFLSIFKNYLPALKWTFSKEDIEKYYKLYQEYKEFWFKIFPNEIYFLEYEDLIDNTEIVTKKILKFCELSWDPSCLKFYEKNQTPIKTASVNQANKAIYKDSKDKFSLFEKYFK